MNNTYVLDLDIKNPNFIPEPLMKQNDTVTFICNLFDNGVPFNLDETTTLTIGHHRPDNKNVVVLGVRTGPNQATFRCGRPENSVVGRVVATVQIYNTDSRVSSVSFDYLVSLDPSAIIPNPDDKTLIQQILAEGVVIIEGAKEATDRANTAAQRAEDATIAANSAAGSATLAASNAQNAAQAANIATQNANAATQLANTAASKADTAGDNAQNAADAANAAATSANDAADAANIASQNIKGWGQATVWNSTTTYSKNNVVTYNGSTWQSKGDNNLNSIPSETNTNWILLALRGVDGTGAVSTVNGKSPDGTGNVLLSADEIGTYTQEQIDEKDTTVKEYFTDIGIGDKVVIVTEQEYVDAERNGMYWVTNSAMDFLPTETDHAATLLVYENTTDNTLVKVFNAINPTTAISYMRTYTYNDSSAIIHDSGWIEGGGGSGGGGGGNVNVTSYPLVTNIEGQTIWEIPTGVYNQANDSTMVFHNTVFLEPVSYTLTSNRLSMPDNPHTEIAKNNVVLVVFRNMHNMQVELDGANIVDGSIPLAKLGQDVQDAINNAGTQIDLVDNLTTNDNTKALAASVGPVITTELGKKIGVNTNNVNSVITNLGGIYAKKTLPLIDFTNNTTSEKVRLTLGQFVSGILKLTMTSNYNNYNASGGCIVYYHVNVANGSIHFKDTNIVSMSSAFAENFYISDIYIDSYGNAYIDIFKRMYQNPLSIMVEYQTTWGNPFAVLNGTSLEQFDLGMVINDPIQQSIFTHVGNSKQGLASAITGKGVPTDANDPFSTMINNINLIPTGVKYATGYAPSSPSGIMFNYVNGATGPTLTYITVGGLGFSPKYVIARTTTDGKSYVYQSIYIESADYVGLNDGTNTVKLSRFNSSSWSNINTVNLFAQKSGDNIFIPIEAGTSSTYQWFAFG